MIPSATRSAPVGDAAEALLGSSPATRTIEVEIEYAARSDAGVRITGESGVGKEGDRTADQRSRRALTPLVTVNCAGIPDSLLDDEIGDLDARAPTSDAVFIIPAEIRFTSRPARVSRSLTCRR
jgi:DNA-binding NtrC family response regulator